MQNPASSDCPCDTTAVRCTEGGRPLLRQGDHAHLQEQQSLDTTSSNEYHSGHTGISGQESGREISAPEVKSDQPFMGEEVINTSTCSGPTMSCGSASGDMCDVVGSEDVTMKGEVMMGVTEAAEREEIMDEVVLPFELDLADTHDLLSLSEEIQHLLDPKNTLQTPPPLVNLSPLDCHALQMEEVETLTAIYGSDMTPLNEQGTCFLINVRFLSEEIKDDDVIRIWFSLPASYPCVPVVFEIEANTSGSFSYKDADDLFDLLMKESLNRVGGMMIFDLVTITQDYMPDLIERKHVAAERQAREDRDKKKTMELEEAFRDNTKITGIPREMWDVLLDEQSPDQDGDSSDRGGVEEEEEEGEGRMATGYPSSFRRKHGNHFQPAQFVGPISNILKQFPEGLQIERIENILRQDLARRFHQCQQAMYSALAERERKAPQMYNLKTQVAFHGTLTKSLPSIVEKGLVIPGEGNKVKVRCGSSLGVGIYLSPSPDFSLSYTDSNRLIVCAALLGRVYAIGSTMTNKHHSRYNALVCGEEWVFFNAAQVLPCYVIVVKQGSKNSKQPHPPPLSSLLDPSASTGAQRTEETADQKRARLAARAKKFLPYGFGPGSRTVVLDVASVDDDEEDYGDYQLLRTSNTSDDFQSGVKSERTGLQEYRYTDITH